MKDFRPEPLAIQQALELGGRIRIARQRRELRLQDVAEKARVDRKTVMAIEKGSLTTSLGAYLAVLNCMNLSAEVGLVADPALDREGALLVYDPQTRRVRTSRKLDHDF